MCLFVDTYIYIYVCVCVYRWNNKIVVLKKTTLQL